MTIPPLLRGPRASHNPRGRARGCCPRRAPPDPVRWASQRRDHVLLAHFGRRACLVAVLSLIPASVLAQGASTATIGGVVRDPSGAVLPGGTVGAGGPALVAKVRRTRP